MNSFALGMLVGGVLSLAWVYASLWACRWLFRRSGGPCPFCGKGEK